MDQEVTLEVTDRDGELRFAVHAKPRSSRSKVLGVQDGALSVALQAPPVDGEANAELVKLLAKMLGVSKSKLRFVAGSSGRRKILAVTGLTRSELLARLTPVIPAKAGIH
jgi:hypothetical protein